MKTFWTFFIASMITLSILNTSCQKQTDYTPQINALQARCDSLAAALKTTNSNLQATNNTVTSLSTSITAIQSQLGVIVGQISSLNTQLAATNSTVNSQSTSIASIQTQLNTIVGQIATLNTQMTTTNSTVSGLSTTIATIQSQLTVITGQITTLNTKLTSTINTVTGNSLAIDSIQNQIATSNNQLNIMLIQLNTLSSQLGILPTPLYAGLVGYYPFNGNANDESFNSNNGNVSGLTLVSDRFGFNGHAYSFNGTSGYIELPSGSTTTLNVIGEISYSFWFKTSQINSGVILSFGEQIIPNRGGYIIGLGEGLGTMGTLDYASQGIWHYSTVKLNDNKWHNSIIVLKSSTISLYVDGKLDSQFTGALPTLSWNGSRRIGVANYAFYGYYNGILDDICIWQRAINQDEITYLATH